MLSFYTMNVGGFCPVFVKNFLIRGSSQFLLNLKTNRKEKFNNIQLNHHHHHQQQQHQKTTPTATATTATPHNNEKRQKKENMIKIGVN
jgi:hypothetical protein